eukprot:GEMP01021343.1.p1 GENE.GEMP01021343.1~~GEMP01021343.1.p1  ORF type:complete len:338 (+),score=61.39 GEMP01021343.1:31-1014(+)
MEHSALISGENTWLVARMQERLKCKFDPRWIYSRARSRSRSLSVKRVDDPHKKKEKSFATNIETQLKTTNGNGKTSSKVSEDPMSTLVGKDFMERPPPGSNAEDRNSDSWLVKAPPGTLEAQGQGVQQTEFFKPKKAKKRKKKGKPVSDGEDSVYEWREKVPSRNRLKVSLPTDDSSDDETGPMPLNQTSKTMISQAKGSYGGYLLAGEGDAMANFVQSNQRIPRRGEVGIKAEEIEELEDLGFVMSGSRHRRMNAVRIRKENQVYSAEEKRALAMYQFEEKASRETALITDLRDMLHKRQLTIAEQGAGSSEDPRFESIGEQKRFI